MHIEDENELYDHFDPALLNTEVAEYLRRRIANGKEARQLSIYAPQMIDQERLIQALLRYIQEERIELDRQKHRNRLIIVVMVLIGVAFISLGFALGGRFDAILLEILSILGSFAIWEAAQKWLIDNPLISSKKLYLHVLETWIDNADEQLKVFSGTGE